MSRKVEREGYRGAKFYGLRGWGLVNTMMGLQEDAQREGTGQDAFEDGGTGSNNARIAGSRLMHQVLF